MGRLRIWTFVLAGQAQPDLREPMVFFGNVELCAARGRQRSVSKQNASQSLDTNIRTGETGRWDSTEHTNRGMDQMSTGMSRRHFLTHLAGYSALALPTMQFVRGLRGAEEKLKKENKSLIVFWMGGGPSHMDLWDLKPESPNGGEFKQIET